ncbi:hypothetical protein GYMLUDRAFT_446672 [Collybiopsis luxurians FD-317 M1]|uniref:BZIP domain-containing protein n=1 Tax=Collybiopsis luxurians FD-317 M1 TaxID=944289 RepID=A0A0D0C699_9AGAR|nr:hypothetical protein GYMLUDRAFT_446672 [Collybiopsis luxurians FD-317 M1]
MPYSLDGLNLVYSNQPATDNNDLLSGAPHADLSLEIWDRLPFNVEDGQEQGLSEEKHDMKRSSEDEEKEQGHTFTGFDANHMWGQQPLPTSSQPQLPFVPNLNGNEALQLLLSTLLQQQQQQSAQQLPNLSIAQLLAQQPQPLGMPPSFLSNPLAPAPASQTSSARRSAPEDTGASAPPPAKRARSRKSSVSVSSPDSAADSAASPENSTSTPLSTAEDKRRRNTAASARFRQKKKEREAALEARAKELQDQVTGLEKECETLRRENNWLKGLVVGVTGAGASGSQNAQAGTTN